ncbi:MAG: ParB N-terminal domain-containing protein, partial [Leptospiraceae bacterium]|nr:ParB N-terminal domain-containing protein [Leptospiraceae bacterium]
MGYIQILKEKLGAAMSRDRSHLVKKVIVNKRGHRQTVLVNPNKGEKKQGPRPAPESEATANPSPTEAPAQALHFVPISQIRELEQYTAKENYDQKTVDGIKASIVANGYNPAFPLQVDSDNGHHFNIVSGHHRYTAVRELIKEGKLPEDFKIPVVVKKYGSEADRLMAQIAENVRRNV